MSDHETSKRSSPSLEPIASGGTRDCFVHPADPGLCIKVPRGLPGLKVCRREVRYIARIMRRYPSADVARIPRYVGRVITDRGPGWVQQRVLNADGTPAATLAGCLDAHRYEQQRESWDAALDEFRHWAMTQPLQLRDLTPGNLCVKVLASGVLRIVPVDGFSPRSVLQRLLPMRRYAAARNREQLKRFALTDMPGLLDSLERAALAAKCRSGTARETRLLGDAVHETLSLVSTRVFP